MPRPLTAAKGFRKRLHHDHDGGNFPAGRQRQCRTTLNKAEKGDPGVSLGTYATILFVLGLSDRLADLADIRKDSVGLELEDEELPQRIRRRKRTEIPGARAQRKD